MVHYPYMIHLIQVINRAPKTIHMDANNILYHSGLENKKIKKSKLNVQYCFNFPIFQISFKQKCLNSCQNSP